MEGLPAELLAFIASYLGARGRASLARACTAGLAAARAPSGASARAELAAATGRNVCVDLAPRAAGEDDEPDAALGRAIVAAAVEGVRMDRGYWIREDVRVVHVTPDAGRGGSSVDGVASERLVYIGDLLDMHRLLIDEEVPIPTRGLSAARADDLVQASLRAARRKRKLGGDAAVLGGTAVRVPIFQSPPRRRQELLVHADVLVVHDFDKLSAADLHYLHDAIRRMYRHRPGRARLPQLLLFGRGRALLGSSATRMDRCFGCAPLRKSRLFAAARMVQFCLPPAAGPPPPVPPPPPTAPVGDISFYAEGAADTVLSLGGLVCVTVAVRARDAARGTSVVLRAGTALRLVAALSYSAGSIYAIRAGARIPAVGARLTCELGDGARFEIGHITEFAAVVESKWGGDAAATAAERVVLPLVSLGEGESPPPMSGNWTLL